MSTTEASVHEAIASIEARLQKGGKPYAATTLRLLKLMTNVVESWEKERFVDDVSYLTDSELIAKFAVRGVVNSSFDNKEQRKFARRIEARIKFMDRLNKLGGMYKAKAVSDILNVSRQTVNNHISTGKLLAIKEGNDYLIPAFQFYEKGKIPNLEEILGYLKDVSPEAKINFFISPVETSDGSEALPYEILKNNKNIEDLEIIRREANLFMKHIAK